MTTEAAARQRAVVGSFEDIQEAAARTTGLTDFGWDGTAQEGFRVLVDDLASPEAGLTPIGNYFHRTQVKSALVGRLMTQARFAEFPQHAEVAIERPIFVTGLPRTGTTALHRLRRYAASAAAWSPCRPERSANSRDTASDTATACRRSGSVSVHTETAAEPPDHSGCRYRR